MKNNKESVFSFTQQEITELLKTTPSGIKKYINELEDQIKNLSKIGVALSKEKDMGKLLETILLEAKRISAARSEEHTSELQSRTNLVCRLRLEKKNYFNTIS